MSDIDSLKEDERIKLRSECNQLRAENKEMRVFLAYALPFMFEELHRLRGSVARQEPVTERMAERCARINAILCGTPAEQNREGEGG